MTNPISAALRDSHPDAEQEFYDGLFECTTIGEVFDLAMNFMHVEGRGRQFDKHRLIRGLERAIRQQSGEGPVRL